LIAPLLVLASHTDTHTLQELRDEVSTYKDLIGQLKEKILNGGRDRAIKLFEDEITAAEQKISALKAKLSGTEISAAGLGLTKTLQRGSSGEEVRKLQEFLAKDKKIYPEGLATGFFGKLTEKAVMRFQEKNGIEPVGVVGPKTRAKINEISSGGAAQARSQRPERITKLTPVSEEVGLTENLTRGNSGNNVARLQEFLSMFPRVYPEKSKTGNFGPATETAVKRFQARVGLSQKDQHGRVEGRTREIVNALLQVGERNKPPKITDVSALSFMPGSTITVKGRGFTATDNSIFLKGKIITTGLISDAAGTSITFVLPNNTPCQPGRACPIKVVNANGISNAHPFKIDPAPEDPSKPSTPTRPEKGKPALPPPPPSPISPPLAPEEPAPTGPVIISLTPWQGVLGAEVTIAGSGFTAKDNSVNFGGVVKAVTGLRSSDGKTLLFQVPQSPCKVGQSCDVSVTNANGTSNTVPFLLTHEITFVQVVSPNGGETFISGTPNAVKWSGGTGKVHVILVSPSTETKQDPRDFIFGWISTSASPDGSVTWDAKTVCTEDGKTCWKIAPGSYKILALSEDELGNLTLWNEVIERVGNWDVSDQPFTIVAGPYIWTQYPNGGEIFWNGSEFIICWWTENLTSQRVKIMLYKAGKLVYTLDRDYDQGVATGGFIDWWTLPSDLKPGSDYTVRIEDTTNSSVFDESDKPFMIDPAESIISVNYPNGGNNWVGGATGYVQWTSANIASQAVNINLLKGGAFYRTLASNVPQQYYGSLGAYTFGTFDYYIPIPADIPDGSDYTVEITDAANSAVRDVSDAAFRVVQLPDTLTIKGRFIDTLTKEPLSGVPLYSWWWSSAPTAPGSTNANGEFSVSIKKADFLSYYYMSFGAWPSCYDSKWFGLYSNFGYDGSIYLYIEANPILGGFQDISREITSGTIDFGDIPFWPFGSFRMQSDTPALYSLYYRDKTTGRTGWGYSSWYYDTAFYAPNSLAAGTDAWVRTDDLGGKTSYSPYGTLPAAQKCGLKTLSYFDKTYQWEPYNVNANLGYFIPVKEGSTVNVQGSASGGISPYNWNVAHGALPQGLSLSSVGAVSGTAATAGYYESTIRAKDANAVSGAQKYNTTVLTATGQLPPLLKVYYPAQWWRWNQGGDGYIGWWSSNLASKAVKIELLKNGSPYRTITSRFDQAAANGYYYYSWPVPTDLPSATDYSVRVSDASNGAVNSTSVLFPITNGGSASWNLSWNGTVDEGGGDLIFSYPTANIDDLRSFELYEKKPGASDMTKIATFGNLASVIGNCAGGDVSSGEWTLWAWCYGSNVASVDFYQTPKNVSNFPTGEYNYQIKALNKAGTETVVANMKFFLDRIRVLKPIGPQNTASPRIEWTLPTFWPQGEEKWFDIVVNEYGNRSSCWGWYVWSCFGALVPPGDTVGYRIYDGRKLEPGKTYIADVTTYTWSFDAATGNWVGYSVIPEVSVTFVVSP